MNKLIFAIVIISLLGVLYYGSWITCNLKVLPSYPIWFGEVFIVLMTLRGLYLFWEIEKDKA